MSNFVNNFFVLYFSGVVAERVDLRYFLSIGMILSGVFTMLFGLAKVWGVHTIGYFLFVQVKKITNMTSDISFAC